MKVTKLLFIFVLLIVSNSVYSQTYVTIPDPNFVTWLQTNYPSCMNGNQMDIDCAYIQNDTLVVVNTYSINDLTGIEYFISLKTLNCSNNQLTSLPSLPQTLISLNCYNNQLTSLPNLPPFLNQLNCIENRLSSLPNLPQTLTSLACDRNYNFLTELPELPQSLNYLSCTLNNIVVLPSLPDSLISLQCSYNNLMSLPQLPQTLTELDCQHNELTYLPSFPQTLVQVRCYQNQLTYLPPLPEFLTRLECQNNQLASLPALPNSIQILRCNDNLIECFPVFPNSIMIVDMYSNPFTCLPNYLTVMDAATLAIPLCLDNDMINNLHLCPSAFGIIGSVFSDSNGNCNLDNLESSLNNFKVQLFSQNDSLINQTFSVYSGVYHFPLDSGSYTVKIDTLNMPFSVSCTNQNLDSLIVLSSTNLLAIDVNFPLTCKPGFFDIGAQSVLTNGWVFPGQQHRVKVMAGDMSQWNNMNCASGISGEVQISVNGPVSYQNVSSGALTPDIINGNTLTYQIPDFGLIDAQTAFGLIFQTETTAQTGDEVCVTVDVTPGVGDNNPINNHYEYCYSVVNSYDPNMKEVYPVNVEPGYEDYLTYTVHFQNTGSAPAFNIRLIDTLNANLDLETFQVINYSHYNTTMLTGNRGVFSFPNIILPDSTSNPEGSKGFIQYRIKPKANLPVGTEIENTAYIYFDYNDPIVTNTTVNEFVMENSVAEQKAFEVKVYPNPFSMQTTVRFSENLKNETLVLCDIYGKEVQKYVSFSGNKLHIQKQDLKSGVYFLEVAGMKSASKIKLMVLD